MRPREDSLFKEDKSTWSDDLGFLATIGWLINKAHEASMNDGDVYDWLWILEQLNIEIEGQLYVKKRTERVEELNDLRKATSKKLEDLSNKYGEKLGSTKQSITKIRNVVMPYHKLLNRTIHEEQLRLKNFKGDGLTSYFAKSQSER